MVNIYLLYLCFIYDVSVSCSTGLKAFRPYYKRIKLVLIWQVLYNLSSMYMILLGVGYIRLHVFVNVTFKSFSLEEPIRILDFHWSVISKIKMPSIGSEFSLLKIADPNPYMWPVRKIRIRFRSVRKCWFGSEP